MLLVTGNTQGWSIVGSGTAPTATPYGGSKMAMFNSYNISSGSSRIYRSSSFAIPSSVTTVTLTLFMYHDSGYATSGDTIQTQISTDGGTTWNDVGTVIARYSAVVGWAQHTIDLSPYKGQTVILGFLGTSGYGNNMYLDDILVTGTN